MTAEWRSTPQIMGTVRASCGACGRRIEVNVYRLDGLKAADRRVTEAIEDHRKRCGNGPGQGPDNGEENGRA